MSMQTNGLINGTISTSILNELKIDPSKKPQCYALVHLIYTVALESAEALIKGVYKQFDALVKNFGCQITMAEVMELVQNPALKAEAAKVCQIATEKLASCEELIGKPPKGKAPATFSDLVRDLDVEISPEMMRLVRLRFLTIVNNNKVVKQDGNDREMPFTDTEPLRKKIVSRRALEPIISPLIDKLQREESSLAADYIRKRAQALKGPRKELIQKMLQPEHVRKAAKTNIASVPLLYNTEASLAGLDGVVLVKNKLSICEKPRDGARELKVHIQLPEGRLLSDLEIAQLAPEKPLAVLEGYVDPAITTQEELAAKIHEIGLMRIIQGNCAPLQQYASNTSQDPLADDEARADIEELKKFSEAARKAIEIDHIYCGSVNEES